jgi:ATP-binding cassette subfamily F protein 3
MLAINQLDIQYGNKKLFNNISVRINEQDRVGLVGVNGAGKSTLLKILAGEIDCDFGVVLRSKYATVGYLPQEINSIPSGRTLYQEAESAFAELIEMQQELERVNHLLSSTDPASPLFPSFMQQQGELQHRLDKADFFSVGAKIEKVLIGLGFRQNDFDKPCNTFSGGWLMRLMLAKHLLRHPSYLLLDEPTNHLDIESLGWLEDFLKNYKGAIILISHDRSFLDNITNIIWELSLGKLTVYKGNYSKYLQDKELRMQIQRAAFENQQAQIQQTMRFVQRFRAKSTKAKQVQSRLKQLSKMDRIEIEETDKSVKFRFPPSPPSGQQTIAVGKVSKSFDNHTVFSEVAFDLQRGDKLAVVGVNGAGKSTLVKLLAGLYRPDNGTIRFGHNVIASYFGQHQAQELTPDLSVLETLSYAEGNRTITEERTLLAAFLFQGDDVDKKVAVLSGGEKSRLALAKMIITPANLLIMDEPTNHLDMASQEILQEAMRQYDGTIIVVSHNRYFLDQFVNKVLVLKDGSATLHHGNLSHYLEKLKEQKIPPPASLPDPMSAEQPPAKENERLRGKELRQEQARLRQEKSRKTLSLRNAVRESEKQIEQLEARKAELESLMADPETYKNPALFTEMSQEYKEMERRLDRQYFKWEDAQVRLEKIEKQYDAAILHLGG